MILSLSSPLHQRRLVAAVALAGAAALCGCGGGGTSAAAAAGAAAAGTSTPAPDPAPSPSAPSYVVHVIIDASAGTQVTLLPAGAPSPPGANIGPAVAGAVITYPDGSQQVADASGTVVPATSAYAQRNAATLETNLEAAPFVTVADPSGTGRPLTAQVDAAIATSTAVSSITQQPQNAYAHILATGPQINLAHVQVHPSAINAGAGDTVPVEAVGLDSSGHVTALGGATVNWQTPSAGSIFPIPGTNRALFRAPSSGIGSVALTATVTAATPAGASQNYSGSGNVLYLDGRTASTVTGQVSSAPGAPPFAAGSYISFVQKTNVPPAAHPYVWFAATAADGTFTRALPPKSGFVAVGALRAASGAYAFDLLNGPNGTPNFLSAATTGATVSASFTLPANPATYIDTSSGYKPVPPVGSYIHDAWYSAGIPLTRHIFDADSGLQPILATNGNPATGTVSDGLFKYWKYQWSALNGALALTIAEAYSSGSAGRHTALITPNGNTTFSYVRYYAPSAAISLGAPLLAAQAGMLLDSDGRWTQSVAPAPGVAAGPFTATLAQNIYSSARQIFGSPQSLETLTYTRTGSGAVTIVNDNYSDSKNNLLWTFSGGRSGYNASAYGTAQTVYSYSGTLTRVYHTTAGTITAAFNLGGTIGGDGSGSAYYANAADGTQVSYSLVAPTATATLRASNGVVTVPALNPQVQATFTISTLSLVQAVIGADPATGYPGSQIGFSL